MSLAVVTSKCPRLHCMPPPYRPSPSHGEGSGERTFSCYKCLDEIDMTSLREMGENMAEKTLAPGIVSDFAIRRCRPTIEGTRLTVEHIMDLLAGDWSIDHVVDQFPTLSREKVLQAIAYATQLVHEQA